jgi:hypothetical protein
MKSNTIKNQQIEINDKNINTSNLKYLQIRGIDIFIGLFQEML